MCKMFYSLYPCKRYNKNPHRCLIMAPWWLLICPRRIYILRNVFRKHLRNYSSFLAISILKSHHSPPETPVHVVVNYCKGKIERVVKFLVL
jgi:hypothetical protein